MSHEYSFAAVPFSRDGDTNQLVRNPDDWDTEDVEGVERYGFREKGHVLGMNGMFTHFIGEDTGGGWIHFLEGGHLTWDSNGRFIILNEERINMLPKLRKALPLMEGQAYHEPFKTLLDEMERMLAIHSGKTLALVIN